MSRVNPKLKLEPGAESELVDGFAFKLILPYSNPSQRRDTRLLVTLNKLTKLLRAYPPPLSS
jgi:hypothetical protein